MALDQIGERAGGQAVSMTIVVLCWPGCIWYLLGVRSYCGYQ